MVNCSILGCKSRTERKDENISFHLFPKHPVTRKSWILSTGRSNWIPKRYASMCSRHFTEKCFRKTQSKVYLEAFSVPTKHIPGPAHDWNDWNIDTDYIKQEVKEEPLAESDREYKQSPKIVMVCQESWPSSSLQRTAATPGTSGTRTTSDQDPLATNDFAAFGQRVAAELSCMPLEDALDLQAQIRQLIQKKLLYILGKSPGDPQQTNKSPLHSDSSSSTNSATSGPFDIKFESFDEDSL